MWRSTCWAVLNGRPHIGQWMPRGLVGGSEASGSAVTGEIPSVRVSSSGLVDADDGLWAISNNRCLYEQRTCPKHTWQLWNSPPNLLQLYSAVVHYRRCLSLDRQDKLNRRLDSFECIMSKRYADMLWLLAQCKSLYISGTGDSSREGTILPMLSCSNLTDKSSVPIDVYSNSRRVTASHTNDSIGNYWVRCNDLF